MNHDPWHRRRAFVTGCNGLLGTWLTARLAECGADDRPSRNRKPALHVLDEHVGSSNLVEAAVLRPAGTLVVGTPDYRRALWHVTERLYGRVAPGGYAADHITHFDRAGLKARRVGFGYEVLECRYVGGCEMIIKAHRVPSLRRG